MDIISILLMIFAYIIGSIPFALVIGKLFYNTDIRQYGSGNVGTSNTFRVLGKQAGIIVLICDLFKGAIPVYIAMMFNTDIPIVLFGLVAALGHVYSIFLHFKGGKAVATGGGAILATNPLLFAILLFNFLFFLIIFKYVSLASTITALLFFVLSFFTEGYILQIVATILAFIIVIRHIPNMKRIKNKTEPKVSLLMKKNKDQESEK